LADDSKSARFKLNEVLGSGLAAERFAKMVSMQGGPADLLENPSNHLQTAPVTRVLAAPGDGCIEYLDTRAIGLCVVGLGGGRKRFEDNIDHRVGLSGFCLVGESVNRGDPLVTIHAADENAWQAAAEELLEAFIIGRSKDVLPAVYEHISREDIDTSRFRTGLQKPLSESGIE
jgi:thymidine phosphorylase